VLVRSAQGEASVPRQGDADLLLEGTVRADNGPVEVNVRLIELEHQQQLWAKRYRVEPADDAAQGKSWDQAAARRIVEDVVARLDRTAEDARPQV
jgi:TolB-like protein